MSSFAIRYVTAARLVLVVFITFVASIAHTLLGVVVVGLFPSLAATAGVFRRWALADDRTWTIKETWLLFHGLWRSELGRANALGWAECAVWGLLLFDYWVVNCHVTTVFGTFVAGILFFLMVFLLLATVVSWVLHAHFNESLIWIVRMAIQMIIARPVMTLVLACGELAALAAYWQWPGLLMTFGWSIPVAVASWAVWQYGKLPGFAPDRNT
ncbi:YesL family protein [Bifidobacterium eulemuris]|uniref:DUF624 domain-containing protein n=1 Tax=Bifidobacterium eulemuris TaxID=1765219 RepID=A0A261G0B1_9BIFI|nr:DUF624 domain-containing protein [Bifidobacterium eulemuris]OZG64603.1 drug resistance transporter EmrB/QacA subfamily protein [Bifidobacterium eulemuris]QOL32378.1 DUF624 domain-containing protein [Bifidobacterium eulemuris]